MRGSRKHVLDWVGQPRFLPELLTLAQPVPCCVTSSSRWMPMSHAEPAEARLDQFGPATFPDPQVWRDLGTWWLSQERGANTPNWDIALRCDIQDRPGLILVEAKANVPELSESPKRLDPKATTASEANHSHIGQAIAEARLALEPHSPGIRISRDSHYQLSNRIAFAWKLATLGVPTVLVYLGFLADTGIAGAGEPFRDERHWGDTFADHLRAVCPSPILERRLDVGLAPFWLLSRTRQVLEVSPPVT